MANDRRKPGRVTPKKGTEPTNARPRSLRSQRRSIMPDKVGPFERPNPEKPLGQVGRRPSSPAKLLAFSIVYIASGVLSIVSIGKTLGVILGVVLIGVGLLWFRGAATAQLRHQARRDNEG